MKNKILLMIAIVALAIGFATVSTILYINGIANIATNDETFKRGVVFTNASTDAGGKAIIEQDGRVITFTSKALIQKEDTAILNYEISNLDKNYNAKAQMSCKFINDDLSESATNDLIAMTLDKDNYTVNSGNKVAGTITFKLYHNAETAKDVGVKCSVVATAIERNTAGTVTLNTTNTVSGVVTDSTGTPLTSGYLAVFSDAMKVVSIPANGEILINGLEDGTHEVYYMGATDPTGKTKTQIKASALAAGLFATSMTNGTITMTKDSTTYAIANVYNVTFEGDNFTVTPTDLKILHNRTKEVTLTPNAGYYVESITCTNDYTTSALVGETATSEQTVTIFNNGSVKSSVCTVNMVEVQ